MSFPIKLLPRAGARWLTRARPFRPQSIPRHLHAPARMAAVSSAATSKTPTSREHRQLRTNTSKTQWAETALGGSQLKVHATQHSETQERNFPAIFLRDVCCCSKCVDPNSTQKNFSTTDIPLDVAIKSLECSQEGVMITWKNDVPGFGDDHSSFIPLSLLNAYLSPRNLRIASHNAPRHIAWSKDKAETLPQVNYETYMKSDDLLFQSLRQLDQFGFVILNGVPEDEKSVEAIAGRIGTIRDTFYGRTWNVKSTPQAKNVAYTQQYLGLHMDLLYMETPPGFQFLHCLKNTCEGGSSLFSDSFNTVFQLCKDQKGGPLSELQLAYHYKNDGQYYYREHNLVEKRDKTKPLKMGNIKNVNYSPPFQAPLPWMRASPEDVLKRAALLKAFTNTSESEVNLFEYRLKEGDCVIFNNRRVLHGRREFDSMSGERWLKGCYVDTDVFESRLRVLREASQEPLEGEAETTGLTVD